MYTRKNILYATIKDMLVQTMNDNEFYTQSEMYFDTELFIRHVVDNTVAKSRAIYKL